MNEHFCQRSLYFRIFLWSNIFSSSEVYGSPCFSSVYYSIYICDRIIPVIFFIYYLVSLLSGAIFALRFCGLHFLALKIQYSNFLLAVLDKFVFTALYRHSTASEDEH